MTAIDELASYPPDSKEARWWRTTLAVTFCSRNTTINPDPLSGNVWHVLNTVFSYAQKPEEPAPCTGAAPTFADLTRITGLARSTIIRHLRTLVSTGWLIRTGDSHDEDTPGIYTVDIPAAVLTRMPPPGDPYWGPQPTTG